MTEEKPLSERAEQDTTAEATEAATTEQTSAAAMPSQAESVAAALSALSNAAAPAREESAPEAAPAPEEASVVFTPPSNASESNATDTTSQTAPPPPPAPEAAVDSYPPPIGAPVAVNATPAVAAAVPPAPTAKRKKWPWILALSLIGGLILLGGITACATTLMSAALHSIQHNERYYDYNDLFNPDMEDGLWNYYYGGMDTTFEGLLDIFNIDEGEITTDGTYTRGAYRVGGDNGIAPGLYYLEGSQNGVSNFYVFHSESDAEDASYDVQASAEYFGNYYVDLVEGDAIFYAPFSKNSTMFIASDQPMDVMPPYKSGCYRVGIDIPAGTYTITCDADAARETDSEAGAYIMDDVYFDTDEPFASESVYVIKGGRQTITVENGQYLELFAAIATPATASTRIPLQHAENEVSHVA